MAELIPAEEFKAYLFANGLGQDPDAPLSAVTPSVWLNPRDDAPEPRDGKVGGVLVHESVTISICDHPEMPGPWFEGFLQHKRFEFIVRSRTAPEGQLVQRKIRSLFEEQKGLLMGQLRVEWSKLIAGESPVASDETSYTTVQAFGIAYRIVSLTV